MSKASARVLFGLALAASLSVTSNLQAQIMVRVLSPTGTHNNKAQLGTPFTMEVGICTISGYYSGLEILDQGRVDPDITGEFTFNGLAAPEWCTSALGSEAVYFYAQASIYPECGVTVLSIEASDGPYNDYDGQWAEGPSCEEFQALAFDPCPIPCYDSLERFASGPALHSESVADVDRAVGSLTRGA